MAQKESIAKAKKTLNRLKFGEQVLSNSEYNLLMNLIKELEKLKKKGRETPIVFNHPNFSDHTWGRGD